jgi:carbonic anhydrase
MAAAAALAGTLPPPARADGPKGPVVDADEALRRLLEGNQRYVEGRKTGGSGRGEPRRLEVAEGQAPFATILACADSRVAPEILMDAGLGDLFVVRVAGNTASPSNYAVMGSLEYALAVLKVPLLMVLGHSGCGAVEAAVEAVRRKTEFPGAIETLVQTIAAGVRPVAGKPGDVLQEAIEANVRATARRLAGAEPILAAGVAEGRLKIVGASYDLHDGLVRLLT